MINFNGRPGFILQGGDPTGTGRKSKSIYGKNFQDEIHDHLIHDKRGVMFLFQILSNLLIYQKYILVFYFTKNLFSNLFKQKIIFSRF